MCAHSIVTRARPGLFWVVCKFDENEDMNFADSMICTVQPEENTQMLDPPNRPSHKETWHHIGDAEYMKGYDWNYFPRGRVEIRNHKAVVYHHPALREMDRFEERIIGLFGLDADEIETVTFKADGSAHYIRGVGENS